MTHDPDRFTLASLPADRMTREQIARACDVRLRDVDAWMRKQWLPPAAGFEGKGRSKRPFWDKAQIERCDLVRFHRANRGGGGRCG